MEQPSYLIGIQRWPLPFFKKYKVVNHVIEALGGSVRIAMQLPDKTTLVIPGLDRKRLKIYADYHIADQHRQLLAQVQQPSQPPVPPLL